MHLQEAILRKTAGPYMDPAAQRLQQMRLKHIQALQAKQQAGKLNAQDQERLERLESAGRIYTEEEAVRRRHNITDAQINKQYQIKYQAQNAAARAKLQALQAGKTEQQATAAARSAARAVGEKYIRGSSTLDALLLGGVRAGRMQRGGKYMESQLHNQSAVDPDIMQRMQQRNIPYRAGAWFRDTGKAVGFTPFVAGMNQRLRAGTQAATRAHTQDFNDKYVKATQQAPAQYRAQRNKELAAAWNKHKGWIIPAGIGLGGLALGSLLARRAAAAPQTAAKPQPYQHPGVADWAQNKHQRGYRSAGTLRQTRLGAAPSNPFSSVFKNFMRGRR